MKTYNIFTFFFSCGATADIHPSGDMQLDVLKAIKDNSSTVLGPIACAFEVERCSKLLDRINSYGLGVDRFERGVYKKKCPVDSDPIMDIYYFDKWQKICSLQTKAEFDSMYIELVNTLYGIKRDPLSMYINKQIKLVERSKYANSRYDSYRHAMPKIEKKFISLASGMTIEDRAINYRTRKNLPPEQNDMLSALPSPILR